jgi:hypothetical protein
MENFIVEKEFKHAKVLTVTNSPNTAIVEALTNYIPLEPFKEIFNFIGDLAKKKNLTKLIFDKRKLTVFHQPSMEWYFVEWKEKMFDQGLNTHRKILPADDVFRQSVRIGREKIDKNYPTKKFNQMDIQYAETIEDALMK